MLGAGLSVACLTASLLGAAVGEEPRSVSVVVYAKSLAVGAVLQGEDLAVRQFPASLASGAVVMPDKSKYVFGQRILEPVDKGEPVLWSQFLTAGDEASCCTWPREVAGKPVPPRGAVEPFDPAGKKLRKAVVAKHDLAAGTTVTAADIAEREYRSDLLGQHAVVDSQAVIGQKLLVPLLAGDPLRFAQLAGFASDQRCRMWEEEYGNIFAKAGAPSEAAKLKCPRGTSALSGMPSEDKMMKKITPPGWVFVCKRPDGTRHGSYAAWSRKGAIRANGSYVDGKQDGKWEWFADDGSRTQASFKSGVLNGSFQQVDKNSTVLASGAFALGLREGVWNWRFADGSHYHVRFDKGMASPSDLSLKSFFSSTSTWKEASTGVGIVVTTRKIAAGERISPDALGQVVVRDPHTEFIRKSDESYILGEVPACDLPPGAPVLYSDFMASDLDVTIEPKMTSEGTRAK